MPDQHAAFGITRATQAKREPVWKDLGLEALVDGGPKEGRKSKNEKMGVGMGASLRS